MYNSSQTVYFYVLPELSIENSDFSQVETQLKSDNFYYLKTKQLQRAYKVWCRLHLHELHGYSYRFIPAGYTSQMFYSNQIIE